MPGESMGGRKAASLPARRKLRLSHHEAALQRERLLTEIQMSSEEEISLAVVHKASVLLGTAWFQATWSGKEDILRAVDWLLRLERKRLHRDP